MKDWHVCIGCGKDTTARGGVCRSCYSNASAIDDDEQPLDRFRSIMNPVDEYEREVDEMEGFSAYDHNS